MRAKIDIDTKTMITFWLIPLLFALAALVIYSARTALIIVAIAIFFAVAINPAVNRLAKLVPSKSRIFGTALSYVIVVGLLTTFFVLVMPPVINQTAKFIQGLPNLVDSASTQYSAVSRFIVENNLQDAYDGLLSSLKNSVVGFASDFGPWVIGSIGSLVFILASTVLILAMAFFMQIEGPAWFEKIWGLYTDKRKMYRHRKILTKMQGVITGYVTGQLMVSMIAGLISGFLVFILSLIFGIQVNLAIPALALMFIFSLIPMFGETIGIIIITAMLLLNNITVAIIFAIFFIIYTQIEGNVIAPKIQSKRLDLSALLIIASVTIGIYCFGLIGGIVSIPIAGCAKVLFDEFLDEAKQKRKNSSSKLSKRAD